MKTWCWFGAKLGFLLCHSSLTQAFFPPLSLMQLAFSQGGLPDVFHLGVIPPTLSLFLLDMLWASIYSAIDSVHKLDDSMWYWATQSIYAKTNRCLSPCLAPTIRVAGGGVTLNMGKYCSLSPEECMYIQKSVCVYGHTIPNMPDLVRNQFVLQLHCSEQGSPTLPHQPAGPCCVLKQRICVVLESSQLPFLLYSSWRSLNKWEKVEYEEKNLKAIERDAEITKSLLILI